jgi:hypothetical protein
VTSAAARRGHALLESFAGAAAIALILGVFGPALDAPTRSYASYGYTPEQQVDHRRLDRDAHQRCADDARGENAGYVITADGAVVCTDKHGRRAKRNQITIAVKTEVRP